MFTYDILLTLPVEIEKIWNQRFSGLTILWALVSTPVDFAQSSINVCSESVVVLRCLMGDANWCVLLLCCRRELELFQVVWIPAGVSQYVLIIGYFHCELTYNITACLGVSRTRESYAFADHLTSCNHFYLFIGLTAAIQRVIVGSKKAIIHTLFFR